MIHSTKPTRFSTEGKRRTLSLILLLALIVFDLKYWRGNWTRAQSLVTGEDWLQKVGVALGLVFAIVLIVSAVVSMKRILIVFAVASGVILGCGGLSLLTHFQGAGTLFTMLALALAYVVLVWTTLRTDSLSPEWMKLKWRWYDKLTRQKGFGVLR